MFGWFTDSGPPKFNASLLSPFATLSDDCLHAKDIGSSDDDMGGVLFGDRAVPVVDGYAYFEVVVEGVKNDDDDGLTVGVTTQLPSPFYNDDYPGCADDVLNCYCVGFDGRAKVEGCGDLLPVGWNPMNLAMGDRVGFYIAPDGAACVLVNGKRVANVPAMVPIDRPVYLVADLLGNCVGVGLLQEAAPPEEIIREFCREQVQDDALDSLYNSLTSGDQEKIEGAVTTARLVGIDQAVIRSAQRSVRTSTSSGSKSPRNSSGGGRAPAATSAPAAAQAAPAPAPAASAALPVPGTSPKKKKSLVLPNGDNEKGARKSVRSANSRLSTSGHRASSAATKRASAVSHSNGTRKSMNKHREMKTMLSDDDGPNDKAKQATAKGQADADADAQAEADAAAARARAEAEAERAAADARHRAEEEARLSAASAAECAELEAKQREEAKRREEEEAMKTKILKSLEDVVASKDVASLPGLLADARKAGVDAAEIARFDKARIDLEKALAGEELRRQKIKGMDDTLATKDPEKIQESLEAAKGAGVDAAEIDRVQQRLDQIKIEIRHRELVRTMDDAVKSADIGQVKEAISEAECGGVDPAEITRVQQALTKLEADAARRVAEEALTAALGKEDLALLMEAIDKAKQADVSKDTISKGEKRLADVKRKHEQASKRLATAMDAAKKVKPPTFVLMQEILAAAEAAKALNIDTKAAEDLYAALDAELEAARQAAREALQTALANRDGEAIQRCMDECAQVNAKDAIREGLDRIGQILQELLETAKTVDKEARKDMIPGMEALMGILRVHGDPRLRKLHNDLQDLKGALRVFCRVRPLNKREKDLQDTVAVEAPNSFSVSVSKAARASESDQQTFQYDAIFLESNTQADVFSECQSLIQSAFDGYNVTIFTYGQTGAGKTWTLYGIPEQPGISPRSCDFVFQVVETYSSNFEADISASMVELYNSTVRDLLSSEKSPPKLDIKQEKKEDGTMAVKLDATQVSVKNSEDLSRAVAKGFGNRKVASTSMNADSSRSHLMFMIFIKVVDKETSARRSGKITIVDLAGSERLAKSEVKGEAAKEAIEINKSLTALGDVMMAITSGSKMIPYRNHKLTQLMQDSLGGTAKTLMFVNISPARSNADETINALKYASRARCIVRDGGGKKMSSVKDRHDRLRAPSKMETRRSESAPPR